MGRKKVIVAGHACLDITPQFPGECKAERLGDILMPGKIVQMEGVAINPGGAVSNTGIAMKLLGADVSLFAKTGKDAFGAILKDIYAGYGVSDSVVAVEGERTSYSVVIAAPGIDRAIMHDPGCNDTFSLEDVKKNDFTDTVLYHFGYPPIMEKIYVNGGGELIEMMKYVKSKKIATSLDLAFVDEKSRAAKEDWKEILTKTLPFVDFFVPSVEELCYMLDLERYRDWQKRAGGKEIVSVLDVEKDIVPLAKQCMELGARVLLLKCGAPGLYYQTASGEALKEISEITGLDAGDWADRAGFEKSYVPERVLSAIGAGDTTIAAFLTAMLEGYSFEMCIHLAAAQGASCVADYSSLGGIKSLPELEAKIKAGWEKQD